MLPVLKGLYTVLRKQRKVKTPFPFPMVFEAHESRSSRTLRVRGPGVAGAGLMGMSRWLQGEQW